MSEHKISMRKLNRAFHETSLNVRNHPEQEAELTHYLLDSLGLLASRLANQGLIVLRRFAHKLVQAFTARHWNI